MPVSPTSIPARWRYYWCEPTGEGRNVFCVFERQIRLEAEPRSATLHVFADSLYRLCVNGSICGYGPARFLPLHPEYDTHEISPWLRAGDNVIRILANARGAPSYQAVPSLGGVAVRGHIDDTISLDLPDGWTVCRLRAWDPDCEHYSFAQGPVEICDTRELHSAGEPRHPPVLVAHQGHWGAPSARAIPPPSLRLARPSRVINCSVLKSDTFRLGFRCPIAEGVRQPFYTRIHSAEAQEVTAGVFWGPLALNGRWIPHVQCSERGNRENVRLDLRAGWNFLFGVPEMLKPAWTWQMELPCDRGLRVQALTDSPSPAAFVLGPPLPVEQIPHPPPAAETDLPDHPRGWSACHGSGRPPSPARELAWDQPVTDLLVRNSPWKTPVTFPSHQNSTIVLDMGDEFLGHAFVEVDAPRGAVLDIGYEERLNADGMPDYFRCNPFVNSADRFILEGGPQRIESFHERGGRYLQLTFRDLAGPVRLSDAGVRLARGDYPRTGKFRCGDARLDWAWEAGERTLRASMADGWIDPWRERGLYLGDALVQGHATRTITGDWRLDPWCLRLWARAQFPDGQLPDAVPSHHETPLCDYTLIWIIALRNYWAASGDRELVRELWPAIPGIFGSPVWKPDAAGLWEVTPEMKVFVDWGVVPEERTGVNAALNAFRFRALECAAEMARALGWGDVASGFSAEAETVGRAFRETFWDPLSGRFTAAKIAGHRFAGPALHANALALAFGIASSHMVAPASDYLVRGLRIAGGFPPGRIEIYFLYYALEALYRVGRAGDAEDAMREYYGFMLDRGAWTLWETLAEGCRGKDSMCHGWSSGALPFLAERVLGVRPSVPGDPSRMTIAPEADSLEEAEGTVPHPCGTIRVKWAVDGNRLRIEVEKPDTVQIEIRPRGRLAALSAWILRDSASSDPAWVMAHAPRDSSKILPSGAGPGHR